MLRTTGSSSLSALPSTELLCSKVPMIPSDSTAARRAATSFEADKIRPSVPSLYRAETRVAKRIKVAVAHERLEILDKSDPLCASDMAETPIPRRGVPVPTRPRHEPGTAVTRPKAQDPAQLDGCCPAMSTPSTDFADQEPEVSLAGGDADGSG